MKEIYNKYHLFMKREGKEMGTAVFTNKNYDYICRYRAKASRHSGFDRGECREIYLSRQQAALLTLLHRTKSFPVFRLMNMYDTSHVYAEILKEPFYISNEMQTEEEILESSEDLRHLCELGLVEIDFGGKDRIYVYHSLEDGELFKTLLQKYSEIANVHPLLHRGVIRLTEDGRTTELICRR